jgi:hypothetical protein
MSKNPRSISPSICDDTERQQRTRNTVPRIFIFGAGVRNWCRDSAALSRLGLISEIRLRCFATGWRNTGTCHLGNPRSRSKRSVAPTTCVESLREHISFVFTKGCFFHLSLRATEPGDGLMAVAMRRRRAQINENPAPTTSDRRQMILRTKRHCRAQPATRMRGGRKSKPAQIGAPRKRRIGMHFSAQSAFRHA